MKGSLYGELFLFIETKTVIFSIISMNIINPLLTTHEISLLPRKTYSEVNFANDYSDRVTSDTGIIESLECTEIILQETFFVFRNEDTNEKTVVFSDKVEIVKNELVFTISGTTFAEGEHYSFIIYNKYEEIFKGLLFVTQYDQDNYTINNGEFTVYDGDDSDSIKVYE